MVADEKCIAKKQALPSLASANGRERWNRATSRFPKIDGCCFYPEVDMSSDVQKHGVFVKMLQVAT